MIRFALLALLVLTGSALADPSLPFSDRFTALAPLADKKPALKPAATVTGEIVRIGDLIDNAGAAAGVPIFRAPDLGETGNVSVARVLEALAPHELDGLDARGLEHIAVTRASRALSPEDIEARILRALAGRARVTDAGSLTLSFDSELRTLHLEPATEPRLARLVFEPRSGRFDAVFELPGSARKLARFTGTYAETFEAATLSRALAAGEMLKPSDITIVRRPKAELAANVVTDAGQIAGLAARRAMRPGQVLRQTDLIKPEIVARNDHVTITYDVPGVTLSLRGKALEAGGKGDVIGVLNVMSKKSIQATVVAPGHVVVSAPARVIVSPTPAPRVAVIATPRATINPNARPSAE